MDRTPPPPKGRPKPEPSRDDRLKAALKANIARRKEQARARVHDRETAPERPDEEKE